MNMTDFNSKAFQTDLLTWFDKEKRDLPWRKDRDAYKVWVSEIMLQQTRVDTVIPYFEKFMRQFPTIEALANADEDEVLKAWEGLGYYSRVRNLHAAVKEVQEKYDGVVPDTPEEISKLKGIGPYTKGAVLSIAYGIPEPAVDGNVMRVLSRIFSIWDDIAKPKTRKIFEEIVRKIISTEDPSSFNQALMELGALICTPGTPSCLLCPVREHCRGFFEGVQTELPVKSKKKKPKAISLIAAVLVDKEGRVLIHKRPSTGLLANLWEFPNVEITQMNTFKKDYQQFLLNEYRVKATIAEQFTTITHVFSHLIWNIAVYIGTIDSSVIENDQLRLVTREELENFAFPVSHQNIYKEYLKKESE